MPHTLSIALVERIDADPIIVVKSRKGVFHAPWDAARATAALRTRLPAEHLSYDIVVMDGEPSERPRFYGAAPDATAYIRNALGILENATWHEETVEF